MNPTEALEPKVHAALPSEPVPTVGREVDDLEALKDVFRTTPDDVASLAAAVLASPWLAERDARVRAGANGEAVTKVFPAGPGYSNSLLFQAPGGYEEDATSVHVSFEDIMKIMGEHDLLEAVEITIRRVVP